MKNKIAKIRNEKNITQEELAQEVKMTIRQLSNIENGSDTKLSKAFAIKKALNVDSIEDLWYYE